MIHQIKMGLCAIVTSCFLVSTTFAATSIVVNSVMLDNHRINTVNGAYCDDDDYLDTGETALLKVILSNTDVTALSGIKAQVSSSADITFSNSGMINFADIHESPDTTTGMVEVKLESSSVNSEADITVTFMSDDLEISLPEPITTTFTVNIDLVQDRAIEDFSTLLPNWSTS